MLYVALTRARKRCFVFDSSVDRRTPLFGYLSRTGVAELGLESLLSVSATKNGKSTAEDWLRQGDNMLTNQLYGRAEMCFLKGGDEARAIEAGGKRMLAEARELPKEARAAAFHRAAMAFLNLSISQQGSTGEAHLIKAARILKAAAESAAAQGEHKEATRIYSEAGRVLRDGVGDSHTELAIACFISAAELSPTEAEGWASALALVERAMEDNLIGGRWVAAQERLRFLATEAPAASQAVLLEQMSILLDFSAAAFDWE